MNDGKKRKITAWEYQYDNGEVALLYHDAGVWRGKKINTIRTHTRPSRVYARSKLKSQVRTTLLSGSGTLKRG